MFKTINQKIMSILGAFLLLLCGVFVASYEILDRQQDDGLLINLAGRQRMLIQMMAKDGLAYADAIEAGRSEEAKRIERELEQNMRVFEATLLALKDGGSAPINLEMTKARESPPAVNPDINAKLTAVADGWAPFRDNLQQLIDSSASDRAPLDYVLASNGKLLEDMNAAVSLMQGVAEAKVSVMLLVQGLALGLGVVLALFSIVRIRSSVVAPLGQLARTATAMSTGDLDDPIRISGSLEIDHLAKSFDRLRISMINTLDAARMGGSEPFDELDELDELEQRAV